MDKICNTFGKPVELVTDRGTAFMSKQFAEYMNKNNIKHRKVAVAAPWANGMVERVNRFLRTSLTKLLNTSSEWNQHLGKNEIEKMKLKKCNLQLTITFFFSKQLCVFFTPIDSSHYFVHKSIKVR